MKKTADILSGFADRLEIAIQQSRYNKNLMKNQTEALAKAIGVTSSVISDWRNGHKMPASKNIVRLAMELNVTMDWLMTGRTPIHPGAALHDSELARLLSLMTPEAQAQCATLVRALGEKIAEYHASDTTPV